MYSHHSFLSCWWFHLSTIFHLSRTIISSASLTVWSLCAITITVFHLNKLCSASEIFCSETESSAEVGSSKSIICGFLSIIFAIASLCL